MSLESSFTLGHETILTCRRKQTKSENGEKKIQSSFQEMCEIPNRFNTVKFTLIGSTEINRDANDTYDPQQSQRCRAGTGSEVELRGWH